ncbi:MAG TPA: hypothetical protein VK017_14895 [Sphingobacterium sp.]|nr:hypothetical protein [Sphingobacterium sp.]
MKNFHDGKDQQPQKFFYPVTRSNVVRGYIGGVILPLRVGTF